MVFDLVKLGRARYVGDSRNMLAHDRWHTDCQGCGVNDLVRRGHAVGFEPDTLDGALLAGYEYCEGCHDKTEPEAPSWARLARPDDEDREEERKEPEPRTVPDLKRESSRYHVLASRRERLKAEITG